MDSVLLQGLKLEDVGASQAVQGPAVVGLNKSCSADIGIDHRFFNDLMRLQARDLLNAGYMALLYVDYAFAAVEVQSTPLILGGTKGSMNVSKCRDRTANCGEILLSTGPGAPLSR